MQKFRHILFFILVSCSFISCGYKNCNNENIQHLYIAEWNYPEPGSVKLETFVKGSNFSKRRKLIEISGTFIHENVLNINVPYEDKVTIKNDLRITLNDSIGFEITDMEFVKVIDQNHWTMGGPVMFCAPSAMKINGESLPRKYLYQNIIITLSMAVITTK